MPRTLFAAWGRHGDLGATPRYSHNISLAAVDSTISSHSFALLRSIQVLFHPLHANKQITAATKNTVSDKLNPPSRARCVSGHAASPNVDQMSVFYSGGKGTSRLFVTAHFLLQVPLMLLWHSLLFPDLQHC